MGAGNVQIRPPARLIDVEAVLLEASEINDAEVGAAGVVVVGGGLPNIVPAGPDELASDIRVLVLLPEDLVGGGAPADGVQLVGADDQVGRVAARAGLVAHVGAVSARHGEQVRAARADGRSALRAPQHPVRERRVEPRERRLPDRLAPPLALVVQALEVQRGRERAVRPRVVHRRPRLPRRVLRRDDVVQLLRGLAAGCLFLLDDLVAEAPGDHGGIWSQMRVSGTIFLRIGQAFGDSTPPLLSHYRPSC